MGLLNDGYTTLISFAENPSVQLAEIEVTPPGLDGGGPISTTTMRNTVMRTNHPKALLDLTTMTATVAYDPDCYNDMLDMMLVNQALTVEFADGATMVFWGYVDKFTPGNHTEGERPTATLECVPTNKDDSGAEILPVVTPAA